MINGNQSIDEMFSDIKDCLDGIFKFIKENPEEPVRHLNWLK